MAEWYQPAEELLGVALHRHSYAEVHGPCPECGGTNRMIVWKHGKYWCRQCHYTGMWLGQEDAKKAKAEYQASRDQVARKAAWEILQRGSAWIAYHQECQSSDHALGLWAESGIGSEAVARWGLGWTAACPVMKSHQSLTIPVFRDGRLVDIRHRLVDPPEEGGKYRTEFPGVVPSIYNLDRVRGGRFLVVEGEKKTIVLEDHGIPTIGIPGADYGIKALLPHLYAFGGRAGVIVGVDPGMEERARSIATSIAKTGAKTWIADFPEKPDDFVLQYGKELAIEVIRQARPIRRET